MEVPIKLWNIDANESVACEIHTTPILMQQMHFSINYVFSDAHAKKNGNPRCYECKTNMIPILIHLYFD
jgi:PP-loop superfamily ATP-utilizing enzyme